MHEKGTDGTSETDSTTQRTHVTWICLSDSSRGLRFRINGRDPDEAFKGIRHRSVTVCDSLWLALEENIFLFFFLLRCHKSRCAFTNCQCIYIWILVVVMWSVTYGFKMHDKLSDLNAWQAGIVNKAQHLRQYTFTFIVPFIWALATLFYKSIYQY